MNKGGFDGALEVARCHFLSESEKREGRDRDALARGMTCSPMWTVHSRKNYIPSRAGNNVLKATPPLQHGSTLWRNNDDDSLEEWVS
jgi:hypothetical protein